MENTFPSLVIAEDNDERTCCNLLPSTSLHVIEPEPGPSHPECFAHLGLQPAEGCCCDGHRIGGKGRWVLVMLFRALHQLYLTVTHLWLTLWPWASLVGTPSASPINNTLKIPSCLIEGLDQSHLTGQVRQGGEEASFLHPSCSLGIHQGAQVAAKLKGLFHASEIGMRSRHGHGHCPSTGQQIEEG